MFHSLYSENHFDDEMLFGQHFDNTNAQLTTYFMKELTPDEMKATTLLFWKWCKSVMLPFQSNMTISAFYFNV